MTYAGRDNCISPAGPRSEQNTSADTPPLTTFTTIVVNVVRGDEWPGEERRSAVGIHRLAYASASSSLSDSRRETPSSPMVTPYSTPAHCMVSRL